MLVRVAVAVPTSAAPIPQAVVEDVGPYSESAKAGLQPGDILLRWSRGGVTGEIGSPYDVSQVELEQEPRGAVTLLGTRGGERREWVIGPDDWGLRTRPDLPPELLAAYLEGAQLAKAGQRVEAAEKWRAAAAAAQASQSPSLAVWLLYRSAQQLADARQWDRSDQAYDEARQATGLAPEVKAQILRAWALTFHQRNDWAKASEYFRQAIEEAQKSGGETLAVAACLDNIGLVLEHDHDDSAGASDYYTRAAAIREKLAPDSLPLARSLNNLGGAARLRGNLAAADEYHRRALSIRERLVPGSLTLAVSLGNLASLALDRGDLPRAEEYAKRALVIQEEREPDSADVARTLGLLGSIAYYRSDVDRAYDLHRRAAALWERLSPGSLELASAFYRLALDAAERYDLEKADEYFQQALAIQQRHAPKGQAVAVTLNGLGVAARRRGDFVRADDYYRQAAAIWETVSPGSLNLSMAIGNRGIVARSRGDLVAAERYMLEALAIQEKVAPGSLSVAMALGNLGNIAEEGGELAKAEDYFQRALAIQEKLTGASLVMAGLLDGLGLVANDQRDFVKAEDYYQRALTLRKKLMSEHPDVARSLYNLGQNAIDRGDLDAAEGYFREAMAMYERFVPGTDEHAETMASLAQVLYRKQRLDEAAALFERAFTAMETQTSRLGGSEAVRAAFRAKYDRYYRTSVDLLVHQKQPGRAFQVLERSRARALLETLAAAEVKVGKGADPELIGRRRTLQQALSARSNRRLKVLGDEHTEEQLAAVDKEIADLLVDFADVEERLRVASPGYASLMQLRPPNVEEIQKQLDSDTILLDYSLGEERSYVFAAGAHSLEVYEIPKRAEIEDAARRVYALLTKRALVHREDDVQEAMAVLSRMVLAPVLTQIAGKRLLVVSDGALQYVPFAALPDPGAEPAAPLVVGHEITSLPSASVVVELRRAGAGRKGPTKAVAVLADPVFDREDARIRPRTGSAADQAGDAERLTRSAADLGLAPGGTLRLPRLAFTRKEAKAILAVSPAGQSMGALDFEANRSTALSPDLAQYRVVHFATHGLVDSRHPELSGLVLSLVDKQGAPQEGFLALQDIYNLSLPADLVVLSACQTALGKEISGEGLLGLTRGFMYAGAQRVMASLWSIDDVATAELMGRFYRAMEQGRMRPAAALRQAQIEMWKHKHWTFSFYWAAFQIQGEWN
jgi:CHAT domain-containing protein/tetratricopeptide (TPR) repeat protein